MPIGRLSFLTIDATPDDARWRTLTDPEGNEFDIDVSAA